LTGSGTAAPQHSVALSWSQSSSSSVVGYNIYRGTKTGGPYSQINSMNSDTTFTDSSVQSGQTYFYVTTAVDGAGKESTFSNQTQAVIPTP
jgi:fibronectin type 3 domain-containing protein